MDVKDLPYKTRVELALRKYDMNRKELASELGISYQSLSQYLNSFLPMPFEIRDQIEEILHLSQQ